MAEDAAPAPVALVLDDEESLREIICRMLRGRGFIAMGTGDPADAVERCLAPEPRVDVLVTDLGQPTGFGAEVARRVTAERSDLPVVFVSGSPREEAVRTGLIPADARLVQKPFRREALLEAVRAALAGEPAPEAPYSGG
jgi:CheY-like chemotaxis protein